MNRKTVKFRDAILLGAIWNMMNMKIYRKTSKNSVNQTKTRI